MYGTDEGRPAGDVRRADPPFVSAVYQADSRRRRSRRTALTSIGVGGAGLAAAALLVLGGCASGHGSASTAAAGTVPAAGTTAPATGASARPAAVPAGQPTRLRLAALGIDATVVPVGVSAAGELAVPNDPQLLGWWYQGGAPGGARGRIVIDGHVDSAAHGPGAFFHLRNAPIGSVVDLTTARGTIGYRVRARRAYAKDSLPADVFATGGANQLVLITCGGTFDTATRHYTDNVVVYATPVTASAGSA